MIHQEDVDYAKTRNVLWTEETVMVTATERRVGPGGGWFTPTTVVATDKRLLLINRSTFGIRNDYESIPYRQITSVRLEKGIISCSVFLRVQGYTSSGEQGFLKSGEQEGEIPGLRQQDAKDLSDYITKMISGMIPSAAMDTPVAPSVASAAAQQTRGAKTRPGAYIFCSQCGAKNNLGAKFCSACGASLGK